MPCGKRVGSPTRRPGNRTKEFRFASKKMQSHSLFFFFFFDSYRHSRRPLSSLSRSYHSPTISPSCILPYFLRSLLVCGHKLSSASFVHRSPFTVCKPQPTLESNNFTVLNTVWRQNFQRNTIFGNTFFSIGLVCNELESKFYRWQ